MTPEFTSVDVPDEPPVSTDPVCQAPGCGAPLHYAGRGRKPKFCDEHKKGAASAPRSPSGRSSGDVESALTILGGMYDGLAAGLMMVSPKAAHEWSGRIQGLQATNRTVLTADKDLTRRINNLARGGGSKFAFVAAHVYAVAPVVAVARMDIAARSAERAAAQQETVSFEVPTHIPDGFL